MPKVIQLPWFARELSPNARCHWAKKSKKAKEARKQGWAATLEAGYTKDSFKDYQGRIDVSIDFYPRTKHKQDLDNLLASEKNILDGNLHKEYTERK